MTRAGGGPELTYGVAGEPVELHCEVASSLPAPRVVWYRDKTEVEGRQESGTPGKHGGIRLTHR